MGIFSKQNAWDPQSTNSFLAIFIPEGYKAKIHNSPTEVGDYSVLLHIQNKMEIHGIQSLDKDLVSLDLVFT